MYNTGRCNWQRKGVSSKGHGSDLLEIQHVKY
jgi:hypothetical protein